MKLASFDCETWAVDLKKYPAPPIVCASYQRDGQPPELVAGKQNAVTAFMRLLKEGYSIGGANFTFDLACLAVAEPAILPKIYAALDEGRLADTHLLEQLHDNALGRLGKDIDGRPFTYSLANLEMRYFGRDRHAEKESGWRLRYHELDGTPLLRWPKEAREYPLADATGTLELLRLQILGIGAPAPRRNLACLAQEMRAAFALKMMSLRGIRTDKAAVEKLAAEVEAEFARSREKFLSVGFVEKRKPRGGKDPETPDGYDGEVPFKYVSKKAPVQERVSAVYGGNPPLTEKGGISCEKDTLLESGDALLEEWGDASGVGKIRSTYIPVLRQGTEMPIHPTFRVLPLADSPGKYKSTTGRCSCTEPNLQNLPREAFHVVVDVPDDYVLKPGEGWADV
jgi:hypothetical protein